MDVISKALSHISVDSPIITVITRIWQLKNTTNPQPKIYPSTVQQHCFLLHFCISVSMPLFISPSSFRKLGGNGGRVSSLVTNITPGIVRRITARAKIIKPIAVICFSNSCPYKSYRNIHYNYSCAIEEYCTDPYV